MRDGFIKVGAATPKVRVADPAYNREQLVKAAGEAAGRGVKLLVFPELSMTAYTCGDLFGQEILVRAAREELARFAAETEALDMLMFVGLPWAQDGKLYNVAAAVKEGRVLGLVPKLNLPNYGEFYEARNFEPGCEDVIDADWEGEKIPMGSRLLFVCREMPALQVAAEICEDLWVACPPSTEHAQAGATVIVNCSASDETTGKSAYRRELVGGQSARLVCGYIYANAGDGESSQDLVFGGHDIIAEDGRILAESPRFETGLWTADLDLGRLEGERRRMSTFRIRGRERYCPVEFSLKMEETRLERSFDPAPFVPHDAADRERRCEEILSIQAMGLKKRLEHTGCRDAVVGISGGLDSTLALLVTARAFDLLEIPRSRIHAITMPCFGTTDRTYQNACRMTEKLGASLAEVDIREAVTLHFRDIGHDMAVHDVTYENSQARERTQVLMDMANQVNGMVIGTGDMSELALGWATYNGDHMSMYGVNASVPKTLVRHLVRYYADTCGEEELRLVLLDVLDTPVSPELLPPEDGAISQKTEDLVGPYELHDFFLYHILRCGSRPSKIFRMALLAFEGSMTGR